MSDQGWRDFLAAEDAGDWVVLHGGATAVFPVLSLGDAARLADAVAQVPGIEGAGVLVSIADEQLTVRLTRGVFQLEPRHVELARAVSTVARRHGAVADRTRAQEFSSPSLTHTGISSDSPGAAGWAMAFSKLAAHLQAQGRDNAGQPAAA